MIYLIAGYDVRDYKGKNYNSFLNTSDYERLSNAYETGYIQLFEEGYLGYILGTEPLDDELCVVDINKVSHSKKRVGRILSNLIDKNVLAKYDVPPKYQIFMVEI